MTFGLIGAGLATADDDGLMPAAAYRRFAGEPPTMPTTPPASLALASGTWSEATVTNVAATTGPAVSNLTYTRCHSLGHVTAGTVMGHEFGGRVVVGARWRGCRRCGAPAAVARWCV